MSDMYVIPLDDPYATYFRACLDESSRNHAVRKQQRDNVQFLVGFLSECKRLDNAFAEDTFNNERRYHDGTLAREFYVYREEAPYYNQVFIDAHAQSFNDKVRYCELYSVYCMERAEYNFREFNDHDVMLDTDHSFVQHMLGLHRSALDGLQRYKPGERVLGMWSSELTEAQRDAVKDMQCIVSKTRIVFHSRQIRMIHDKLQRGREYFMQSIQELRTHDDRVSEVQQGRPYIAYTPDELIAHNARVYAKNALLLQNETTKIERGYEDEWVCYLIKNLGAYSRQARAAFLHARLLCSDDIDAGELECKTRLAASTAICRSISDFDRRTRPEHKTDEWRSEWCRVLLKNILEEYELDMIQLRRAHLDDPTRDKRLEFWDDRFKYVLMKWMTEQEEIDSVCCAEHDGYDPAYVCPSVLQSDRNTVAVERYNNPPRPDVYRHDRYYRKQLYKGGDRKHANTAARNASAGSRVDSDTATRAAKTRATRYEVREQLDHAQYH